MSTGTAALGSCLASQAEAFSRACSSVAGVAASGVYTCDGAESSAVLAEDQGGAVTVPYVLRVESPSGAASSVASMHLQACERYDIAYHAPLIAAFWAALVAVLAFRLAYTRVFNGRDAA